MIHHWRNNRAVNSNLTVHGLFLFILLPLIAVLAAGCFVKSFDQIRPGIADRGHYIENVPFVSQGTYDCGPAALASVFAFWKHPVDISHISSNIYLTQLHGTIPTDMDRYAKEAGFVTASPHGGSDDLRSLLRTDRPVICLLDLGYGRYRHPHYVTVIGFDDVNRLFIMHDGDRANLTMSYDDFETAWSRAEHWMIMVTPAKTE